MEFRGNYAQRDQRAGQPVTVLAGFFSGPIGWAAESNNPPAQVYSPDRDGLISAMSTELLQKHNIAIYGFAQVKPPDA
jgi:hypothetical protein